MYILMINNDRNINDNSTKKKKYTLSWYREVYSLCLMFTVGI